MQYFGYFLLLCLLIQVNSHGYMLSPKARQFICSQNGKDPACQQAIAVGSSMIYDKHSFGLNIPNYKDLRAVKRSLPHNLCGAGKQAFSGASIIAKWKPNEISRGPLKMEFCATAPHNPSYWEVYISREGYDASQSELRWCHLQKLQISQVIQSNGKDGCTGIYEFTINNLPNRSKQFVLFVRWQRELPHSSEGFYNCVDVIYK